MPLHLIQYSLLLVLPSGWGKKCQLHTWYNFTSYPPGSKFLNKDYKHSFQEWNSNHQVESILNPDLRETVFSSVEAALLVNQISVTEQNTSAQCQASLRGDCFPIFKTLLKNNGKLLVYKCKRPISFPHHAGELYVTFSLEASSPASKFNVHFLLARRFRNPSWRESKFKGRTLQPQKLKQAASQGPLSVVRNSITLGRG